MTRLRPTLLLALFTATELASLTAAQARGGGSSFMNSPGYQRRLQESRGYVTNRSGSIYAPPATAALVVAKPRRQRR